jgi:hypothetical protein
VGGFVLLCAGSRWLGFCWSHELEDGFLLLVHCLSLSYEYLAVSKWRTHSRFCSVGIVPKFVTSILSARCTSL